eukprot:UN09433
MYGRYWQCVERKKLKSALCKNNAEKYDPSIGRQVFRLKDSDRTITKNCSVLRKRRRNEADDDVFSMENVKNALRCFATVTGSTRDGVHSDCSDSSLIHGVSDIAFVQPQKKRRLNKVRITQNDVDVTKVNTIDNYVQNIGQTDDGNYNRNDNNENKNGFVAFDFPYNENENDSNDNQQNDNDFDM